MGVKIVEKIKRIRHLPSDMAYIQGRLSDLEQKLSEEHKKNVILEGQIRNLYAECQYLRNASLRKAEYLNALSSLFYQRMHLQLNLENPNTYNEKLQWFKLYGITPEITRLADKYRVRDFVAERIGEQYMIPLLGVWKYPEEIDFSHLPDRFVLKANHGCGYNYIVHGKKEMDTNAIIYNAWKWLQEDYSLKAFEMQYRDIPRLLLAEEYIENHTGDLNDYKFRCFNGKVKLIAVVTNRSKGLKMDWFDREWNTLPIIYNEYPHSEKPLPRPDNLGEMIKIAETLAEGFPHVRVDLYRLNNGRIYFGEMTFTPSSGMAKWDPPELDLQLGQLFTYPGMPE